MGGKPSSPRTWGCFRFKHLHKAQREVFPTHVGVFPTAGTRTITFSSLPHARGGVSAAISKAHAADESSPRTWGCFCAMVGSCSPWPVFPTHVGVFLCRRQQTMPPAGLPHARGGVSIDVARRKFHARSSPRTWGCFRRDYVTGFQNEVFPTHVGVFPRLDPICRVTLCLPHARGGVSGKGAPEAPLLPSSPRTWGCFFPIRRSGSEVPVFPTHVGVFPARPLGAGRSHSLPHARGGVSAQQHL